MERSAWVPKQHNPGAHQDKRAIHAPQHNLAAPSAVIAIRRKRIKTIELHSRCSLAYDTGVDYLQTGACCRSVASNSCEVFPRRCGHGCPRCPQAGPPPIPSRAAAPTGGDLILMADRLPSAPILPNDLIDRVMCVQQLHPPPGWIRQPDLSA
jgi:hypothetical protein